MKNSGLVLWTERKPIHMDEVVEVVACRNSQLVKLVHDCACPKRQAQQLVACAALCLGMHEVMMQKRRSSMMVVVVGSSSAGLSPEGPLRGMLPVEHRLAFSSPPVLQLGESLR